MIGRLLGALADTAAELADQADIDDANRNKLPTGFQPPEDRS